MPIWGLKFYPKQIFKFWQWVVKLWSSIIPYPLKIHDGQWISIYKWGLHPPFPPMSMKSLFLNTIKVSFYGGWLNCITQWILSIFGKPSFFIFPLFMKRPMFSLYFTKETLFFLSKAQVTIFWWHYKKLVFFGVLDPKHMMFNVTARCQRVDSLKR